jgi:hypothetical protein
MYVSPDLEQMMRERLTRAGVLADGHVDFSQLLRDSTDPKQTTLFNERQPDEHHRDGQR